MPRRRHTTGFTKQLIMLIAIPIALTGVGYALYSQKLTVSATVSKPLYSSSLGLNMAYNLTETRQGSKNIYTLDPVTITNRGSSAVTDWQLRFSVPADAGQLTCHYTVTCTQSLTTIYVSSGSSNGSLNPGGSTSFTMSFSSTTTSGYMLQDIYINGTKPLDLQTIPGLTITNTVGRITKSGPNSTYPYTFTISNNSGQPVTTWQAVCGWGALPTTSGIPSTVNYITASDGITFTSKSSLANGTSLNFGASFTIKSGSWALSGCTIRGVV